MVAEAAGDERRSWPRASWPRVTTELAAVDDELRQLMVPPDPHAGRDVIVEIRGAEGGEEANLFARDLYDMYRAYAARHGLKVETLSLDASDLGGVNEVTFSVQGDRRLAADEVRGRAAPGAAGAGDREPGPHPHVVGDRARAAGGRRGRGRRRRQGPPDRRVPLQRSGRPERQHHRLGRAHHPRPDRHRRVDAGRAQPAAEPPAGDAGAAGPAAGARPSTSATPSARPSAARRSAAAGGARRSGPTTSRRTGSPTTASASRSTGWPTCWPATSTTSSPRWRPTSGPASSPRTRTDRTRRARHDELAPAARRDDGGRRRAPGGPVAVRGRQRRRPHRGRARRAGDAAHGRPPRRHARPATAPASRWPTCSGGGASGTSTSPSTGGC